mmetsp:Transcript_7455/g.13254  ORF Transcript_7455/g.13254 Transcript_7455/m.13254 type:complete len:215 (+) Transcript_7455:305-949(+)
MIVPAVNVLEVGDTNDFRGTQLNVVNIVSETIRHDLIGKQSSISKGSEDNLEGQVHGCVVSFVPNSSSMRWNVRIFDHLRKPSVVGYRGVHEATHAFGTLTIFEGTTNLETLVFDLSRPYLGHDSPLRSPVINRSTYFVVQRIQLLHQLGVLLFKGIGIRQCRLIYFLLESIEVVEGSTVRFIQMIDLGLYVSDTCLNALELFFKLLYSLIHCV